MKKYGRLGWSCRWWFYGEDFSYDENYIFEKSLIVVLNFLSGKGWDLVCRDCETEYILSKRIE